MTRISPQRTTRRLLTLLCTAGLAACGQPAATTPEQEAAAAELAALTTEVALLEAEVQQVKDANAIKRLQRAYGYYVEEGLWDEVADLFSDDATLELARDGVYQGKERIRAYFTALGGGQRGLREGQLNEQLQVMPVVTLGADGQTAKARWRNILLVGQLGEHAEWGEGPFENDYVKENGVWKISSMRWQQAILVPYQGGWAANEDYNQGIWVSGTLPPDAPPTDDHGWWPETYLPPFHFRNPVGTYQPESAPAGEVEAAAAAPTTAAPTATATTATATTATAITATVAGVTP